MIKGTTYQSPKYQPISVAYSYTKTFCGRVVNNVSRNLKSYLFGFLLFSPTNTLASPMRKDNEQSSASSSISQRPPLPFFRPPPVPSDALSSPMRKDNEQSSAISILQNQITDPQPPVPGDASIVRDTLENGIKNALNISFSPTERANYVASAELIMKEISNRVGDFLFSYQIDSFETPYATTAFGLQAEASKHMTNNDWDKCLDLVIAIQKNNEPTNKESNGLLKQAHKELKKIIYQISANGTPGETEDIKNEAVELYVKALVKFEKRTLNGLYNVVENSFDKSTEFEKRTSDAYSHMLDFSIKNLIENHIPSNNTELNNDENATLNLMLDYYMRRSDFSNPSHMKFDSDAKTMRLCFKMIKRAKYLYNLKNDMNMNIPNGIKHQMAELSDKIKSTAYRLSNAVTEKEKLILSAKEKHEYATQLTENKEIATKELEILLKARIIESSSISKSELDKHIEETQTYASDIIDELSNKNKKSNVEHLKTNEIKDKRKLIKKNRRKLKKLREEYEKILSTIYTRKAHDVVEKAASKRSKKHH